MLPMWLKLSYSAFVALLVPIDTRQYGWGNFLWFSDVALLLGCVAIWLEHPLLASTQAVAVVIPEAFWLTTGTRLLGLTDYMFYASIPRFVRALSLFHVWLPCVLVWLVWRLGYDRRAFLVQVPRPITFDKPGVIALGCNIHDWMLAYVLVLQTPYFTTTDSRGTWHVDGLPVGNYEARVWHPLMRQEMDQTTQRLAVSPSEPANVRFVIALKRDTRRPRPIIRDYDRRGL